MKTILISLLLVLTLNTVIAQIPSYLPTNGLKAWLPFTGNTNDGSGNNNNGINTGAVLTQDRFGNVNSAYYLDSIARIKILPSTSLNTDTFSVSFWARPEYNFTNSGITSAMATGITPAWLHLFSRTDTVYGYGNPSFGFSFYVQLKKNFPPVVDAWYDAIGYRSGTNLPNCSGSNNMTQFYDTSYINLNLNWDHLIFVYTYSSIKFYKNGNLIADVLNCGFDNQIGARPMWLGGSRGVPGNQWGFYGKIDDFAFYNRILTTNEIQNIYSGGCVQPSNISLGTERSTIICPDDSVKIFIVSPVTAGLTYQWYSNNSIIPGATNNYYYASDYQKYKVAVSSGPSPACKRNSGLIEPIAAAAPSITITPQGSTSICAGDSVLLSASVVTGYGYEWRRFGVLIPGANSSNYNASQSGVYKAKITSPGGCVSTSPGITVNVVCRIANTSPISEDVLIYPNPSTGQFTVELIDLGNEIATIVTLIDPSGKLIEQKEFQNNKCIFNISHLSPGNYQLKINLSSGDILERSVNLIR